MATFEETRTVKGNTAARNSTADGSWVAFSVLVQPSPPDATVDLSWTAATDPNVTGYELTRTGGGSTSSAIAGRTTTAATDTSTTFSTAHTYALASVLGGWRWSAVTAPAPAC